MRKMGLKGPGSNSGLRTENPDILIAEMKQIMRGGGGQKRSEKINGPSKACKRNECHTLPLHHFSDVSLLLCGSSCSLYLGFYLMGPIQFLHASSSLWYKLIKFWFLFTFVSIWVLIPHSLSTLYWVLWDMGVLLSFRPIYVSCL